MEFSVEGGAPLLSVTWTCLDSAVAQETHRVISSLEAKTVDLTERGKKVGNERSGEGVGHKSIGFGNVHYNNYT